MSIDDWKYNDHKMKIREQALKVLFAKFSGQMDGIQPKYTQESIYNCANEWVELGNMHTAGIVKYCEAYYLNKENP